MKKRKKKTMERKKRERGLSFPVATNKTKTLKQM